MSDDLQTVRETLDTAMIHADHLTGCCCVGEAGGITEALNALARIEEARREQQAEVERLESPFLALEGITLDGELLPTKEQAIEHFFRMRAEIERLRGLAADAAKVMAEEIKCPTCEGTGTMHLGCPACDAMGYRTQDCGFCHGTGDATERCAECDGSLISPRCSQSAHLHARLTAEAKPEAPSAPVPDSSRAPATECACRKALEACAEESYHTCDEYSNMRCLGCLAYAEDAKDIEVWCEACRLFHDNQPQFRAAMRKRRLAKAKMLRAFKNAEVLNAD